MAKLKSSKKIMWQAVCRKCSKQMKCVNCAVALQGTIKRVKDASKNNGSSVRLSCGNCQVSYGWAQDQQNYAAITYDDKLIVCPPCASHFKVIKQKVENLESLRDAPINIQLAS